MKLKKAERSGWETNHLSQYKHYSIVLNFTDNGKQYRLGTVIYLSQADELMNKSDIKALKRARRKMAFAALREKILEPEYKRLARI